MNRILLTPGRSSPECAWKELASVGFRLQAARSGTFLGARSCAALFKAAAGAASAGLRGHAEVGVNFLIPIALTPIRPLILIEAWRGRQFCGIDVGREGALFGASRPWLWRGAARTQDLPGDGHEFLACAGGRRGGGAGQRKNRELSL